MSTGFSLYQARPSVYHRLHPLTKFEIALATVLVGLLWPGAWGSYAVMVLAVAPLAVWSQVGPSLARAVWNVVWPFALSALVIQGLFWQEGPVLLTLGPLQVRLEGLRFAVSSIGRIALVVSSFMLLALTTRPDMLMLALTQIGLPASFAYIVATTIQIVPRFQARVAAIVEAQQARGLEVTGGLLQRARALPPLALPLVLGSLVEVEERAMAVEARGFAARGPKTSLIELVDSRAQAAVRWLLRIAVVAVLAARVIWRLSN
jgi:energy-coupling factor transport system permease protein